MTLIKKKKGFRGKLPTKKSINLILVDEKKVNPVAAALGIIVIIALAVAFSKFLVYDRIMAVSAAEANVARLQSQLQSAMAELDNYSDTEERYAHYTIEGMTPEELYLVDRTQIMDLIAEVLPVGETDISWNVGVNLLVVEFSVDTLETANELARELEKSPIVNSCLVSTANKSGARRTSDDVRARLTVYLQQAKEETA